MSPKKTPDERTPARHVALRQSALEPPPRYAQASELDKARVYERLFGEPPGPPVSIGRFILKRLMGSGGMGEIYEANDDQLGRRVAIKLVRSDRTASSQADDRLLREAQILAQLSHPNIVQVYEVGRFEGRVFIAMEFIRGRSMRAWLKEHSAIQDKRYYREVLRLFTEAGRGLQAAHTAGLVHRDFKPDNILIGEDGRPRVVDFGLARTLTATSSNEYTVEHGRLPDSLLHAETLSMDGSTSFPLAAERRLTAQGQILGTPLYMAPEQMRGEETDQRSDQFSFCVSLYEALHGVPPFSGRSLDELQEAVTKGLTRTAPRRGAHVAAPVHHVLCRGLAAVPAERFPDMRTLLDMLEAWPRRRQRWIRTAITVLAISVAAVLYSFRPEHSDDACSEARASIVESWSPARRSAVEAAFISTGRSYAAASFHILAQQIEQYVGQLASENEATCRANEYRQQPTELLELRTLCIAGRRQRLEALLTQLEHADGTMVERATVAASELPALSTCLHAGTLRSGAPVPAPEEEAEVERIRRQLARARTEELLGHSDEALRIAQEQLAPSEYLGYGPLHAEVLYQSGRVLVFRGTKPEITEGEKLLEQATYLANNTHHDELVAEIMNYRVLTDVRNHSNTDRVHEWSRWTESFIIRIGNPPLQRAHALRNLGRLYFRESRMAEAEDYERQALALIEHEPGVPPLFHALYLHDLANTVRKRNRFDEASKLYTRALEEHIAVFGEAHPYVADVRFGIAMLYVAHGELDTARELLDEVLRIHMMALGEAHPLVGKVHLEFAELDRQRGALVSAYNHVVIARDIYERAFGRGHRELADVSTRFGALAYRRGNFAEALAHYKDALAIQEHHLVADDVVYTWINIAEAEVALERHDEALKAARQAEQILAKRPNDYPTAVKDFLAGVRGRAMLGKGRIKIALELLTAAVHGLPKNSMPVEWADACWALVQALSRAGQQSSPLAHKLAREALSIYEQQGSEVHTPRKAIVTWLETTVVRP